MNPNPLRMIARARSRNAWADPARRLRTLESFAATEEDGGKDLLAAARRVADPELRGHLERHAADELRHAELFRRRAAQVRAEAPASGLGEGLDRPYDLARGRPGLELDSHGFFTAGLFDELGAVPYVAMLHVAERRAASELGMHRDLCGDAETRALFEDILRDEKYHVAYTGRFLDQWRAQGRVREVESALSEAQSSRALGAWKRLGLRSAAGFGHVLLFLLYCTVLAPFGLFARSRRGPAGWRAPQSPKGELGQY